MFSSKASFLVKIIEYLKKHAEIKGSDEEEIKKTKIKDFDKEFVSVKMQKLFNIILVANFLDIKPLLDLCAQAIADKIKNKSHVVVRQNFNVQCDYTREEEDVVRKENEWGIINFSPRQKLFISGSRKSV
ncbi:SKP1-like protein 5 [Nicotiana tomentosiformis]|uniref:SKP1-like protein 5 n=1 Tax=Nicotiana tomentosiformis TaxID=4098 RepID=UPI00388C9F4E